MMEYFWIDPKERLNKNIKTYFMIYTVWIN